MKKRNYKRPMLKDLSVESRKELLETSRKTKTNRPSKGMRKHTRKLKQEARRIAIPGTDDKKKKRPAL